MREIKFRAWDGRQMLNRTLHDRNWYTWEDKPVCVAMPRDANTMKVMQYTGLKDKNGVEIYEGDVCLFPWGQYVVEFNEGRFELVSRGYDTENLGDLEKLEIIGNIYENPELLEADK